MPKCGQHHISLFIRFTNDKDNMCTFLTSIFNLKTMLHSNTTIRNPLLKVDRIINITSSQIIKAFQKWNNKQKNYSIEYLLLQFELLAIFFLIKLKILFYIYFGFHFWTLGHLMNEIYLLHLFANNICCINNSRVCCLLLFILFWYIW